MKTLNEIKTFIDEELLTNETTEYCIEVFNDVNVDPYTIDTYKSLEEAYESFKALDLEEMEKKYAQLYVLTIGKTLDGEETLEETTILDNKEA